MAEERNPETGIARQQLQQAIAAQESLRGILPDAVIEATIAALQEKLAALEPARRDEQRKLVTILFADLAGWTQMASTMDAEDVQAVQKAYFAAITPPIEAHGGSVEKYIGDAVLAAFGVPEIHEDDPERAVRAALAMQQAWTEQRLEGWQVAGLKVETGALRNLPTFNLQLRIGIHTGPVVSAVDADGDFVVTGDTVNLASRMESAAQPGTVLISQETHKFVGHAFDVEAVESIQAKGKAEPVPAFQVISARPQAPKPRGIAGLDSPLVGRQTEFAALQQALAQLQRGSGGIVTLTGEAGIGKSRLVAELRKLSIGNRQLSIVNWIEGRCLSFGTTIPYLLWLDLLRSALDVTMDDSPKHVRGRLQQWVQGLCPQRFDDVYPYLAHLMALPHQSEEPASVDIEELTGQELRQRTFAAIETTLARSAQQQPLVLVCEDLHWADPTSLQLLERILPLSEQTPLLLICVMRVHKDHRVWKLHDVTRERHAQRHTDLRLQTLSPTHSDMLVANLLHADALPPALRGRILERAEGNPFFVEEVIRSLIDLGAIAYDTAGGTWSATQDVEAIPIPGTLQGVLAARIDRLQADTRHVLRLAAVIGRIFLHRVLIAIAQEERDLEGKLAALQQEELIRQRARLPELEFIFKHALTQEAAYNGILRRERRLFHRQVAQALEQLFPERIEEMLGLLAHHWEGAGDGERAVEYLQRAGDQARLAYAHQEAIDFYRRALAILEAQGDHDRSARTLMKLGLTHHDAFQFQAASQAFDRATQLWQHTPLAARPAPAPHALRLVNIAPRTLDPSHAYDGSAGGLIEQLFSGLVGWDQAWSLVPEVARSWQVLEGGLTYLFWLRDGLTWSDGHPLTADDFLFAIQRLLESATDQFAGVPLEIRGARAYHRGEITDFDQVGVRAPDPLTLRIELAQPASYFLHLLARVYPIPRHAVRQHGDRWTNPGHMASNGPFRLERWQAEREIVLRRNPRYHGHFPGNIEEVVLALEKNVDSWLHTYEADEVDAVRLYSNVLGKTLFERIRRQHAAEYHRTVEMATAYIGFDLSRPPFDDLRVRRAFGLALDLDTLSNITFGGGLQAASGLLPPGMPGHSPDVGLTYDPEHARQLMAQAGYPGGRGFPRLTAPVISGGFGFAEAASAMWRTVLQVDVSWQAMDFVQFFEHMAGNPVAIWGLGEGEEYPDPHSFSLPEGFAPGWLDERYRSLLDQARRTMDQATRLDLYREADRIIAEDVPILPVYYPIEHLLVKPWVRRFTREWCKWHEVIIDPH